MKKSKSTQMVQPSFSKDFKLQCEQVRKVRIVKGVRQYYIKWKGLPQNACTWEKPDKLGAFKWDIQAFNNIKKYEIQWMERQYNILNHNYLRKFPLQVFEIQNAEDLELRNCLQRAYLLSLTQLEEQKLEDQNLFKQITPTRQKCQIEKVEETQQQSKKKYQQTKTKKIGKKAKSCKQLLKQQRKIKTANKILPSDYDSFQDEIQKALLSLIRKQKQKQKQREIIPSPPSGFQIMSFEVEISECSFEQIQKIPSEHQIILKQTNPLAVLGEQQMSNKDTIKPNYEKIKQEIDHYKLFFQGKYSIYHYRDSPSDQDQSSFPPKHMSSDSSQFDSLSSSSNNFDQYKTFKSRNIVKRKLNLSKKDKNQDVDLSVQNSKQKQEQINSYVFNGSAVKINQIQLHSEKENLKIVQNSKKLSIEQGNNCYSNGFERDDQQNWLQLNEKIEYIENQNISLSNQPFQFLNIQGKQNQMIQNKKSEMMEKQNQQIVVDLIPKSQPFISLQSQIIEEQEKDMSQIKQSSQLPNENTLLPNNLTNVIIQNIQQESVAVEEREKIRQINEEVKQIKKEDEIKEIRKGDFLKSFNGQNGQILNKTKLISKQGQVQRQNLTHKTKSLIQNKKKQEISTQSLFIYRPVPIGSNYDDIRKYIDENTLTWTEMSSGRLPSFVKILDEVTVDEVNYVYCLFWQQECQLFQKFVMLSHLKRFYGKEFQCYKQGIKVRQIKIQISDIND